MSSAAAPVPRPAFPGARARIEALLPLVGAYLLLSTLYAWQAWRRETPTIFTDELELTQLARSIAETGEPARRGDPYGFSSLVPWLTAPFWWLDPVSSAYEALKTVQAFVMATAIFPAYRLARMVLGEGWAIFAAVATIAAPALSYAPFLVEEPWAYPAATLALWATVRAVDRPSRTSIGLAVAACLLAASVRSQLVALLGALVLSLLYLAWNRPELRRWRAAWRPWDWVGAGALAAGAVIAVVAFIGHRSGEWETATTLWKGRMVEYGSWAGGAFAIGIGIVPAIALLSLLALPRAERARTGVRALVVVSAAALVSLGWYAAIKGAYISTTPQGGIIVERNLMYLSPLAFVATAYLLSRAAAPAWAVVVSGAAVLGMIVWVPVDRGLDNFPYYEAHGFSILALANREWSWPRARVELALVLLTVVATAALVLLATGLLRRRPGVWAPAALCAAILAWNVTAEIYAEVGEHDFSARVETNIPKPNDWVDRAAGNGTVALLGQRLSDSPLGVGTTEFWNRSIVKVWSVDGTGPGPGDTLTPDLVDVDGTLFPDPKTDFVLATNGVRVVGEEVAENEAANATLVRLDGPIRLKSNATGIAADGWAVGFSPDPTVARAAFNRFDVAEGGTGRLLVNLSRETFCPSGGRRLPGRAQVRIGEIGRGADKQPAILRETAVETTYVPVCGVRPVVVPTPDGPWRAEVAIETFVPAEVDPNGSAGERRALGARVSFDLLPD